MYMMWEGLPPTSEMKLAANSLHQVLAKTGSVYIQPLAKIFIYPIRSI